ncbi:MAG: ankyrin repeat domain-containing protein [Candidatus Marsarchaeota archaeon]|jgi:ankyrin repeat protein|nr:ankyrin repeat domain-containing protein [Candidatus Marsarchaeota archaeon]MCL5418473.1 ankyrin repeat domain-containing protein [Candidatus Marsarchaeota archaeon]
MPEIEKNNKREEADKNGLTPLMYTMRAGNKEIAQTIITALLRGETDLNIKDKNKG